MEINRFAAILLLFATTAGCDTRDERAVKLATESANRQAEQNQVVAEMGREMTDNQRRIVEAVADSRKDLVTLQKEVAVQRGRLDAERKEIAAERRYESLLAVLAAPAGWITLAALPLVLCWLLLANLRQPPSDEDPICQLLIEEFIHGTTDRLPAPDSNVHKLRHDPASYRSHQSFWSENTRSSRSEAIGRLRTPRSSVSAMRSLSSSV